MIFDNNIFSIPGYPLKCLLYDTDTDAHECLQENTGKHKVFNSIERLQIPHDFKEDLAAWSMFSYDF